MVTNSAPTNPRLNPFAFPSTTDSRFILLILSVVGSTTFVYSWLVSLTPGYRDILLGAAQACGGTAATAGQALAQALAAGPLADQTPQLQATQAYDDCISRFELTTGAWSLGGVVLLVAVAAVVYWLLPRWIIRQRKLVELDAEDAAEVLQALADLCREVGIHPAPTFLGAPGLRSTDALAFGLPGRRFVGLDNGLITLFYTRPERFRAIVLHELAHIRNADIDKAYLTVAASLAFVVVAGIPLVVSMIGEPLDLVLQFGIRLIGLTALVLLAGAAVLRARESYADVRASTTSGAETELIALLDSAPAVQSKPARWQAALRLHPDPSQRRDTLRDPAQLLRAETAEAFAAGLAAALVLPRITSVVSSLAIRLSMATLAPSIGALIIGPVLVGTIGLGIWRESFVQVARGGRRPRYARLAVATAVGLAAGELLAFDAYSELLFDPVAYVVQKVLWAALIALVLYAFIRWAAAAAMEWLGRSESRGAARRAYAVGLVATMLVFVAALAVLVFVDAYSTAAVGTLRGPGGAFLAVLLALGAGLFLMAFNVPVLMAPALIALWAYPLAASTRTRRRETPDPTNWEYLDNQPVAPDMWRARVPATPGPAIRAGVVAGMVFLVIDLIINLSWHTFTGGGPSSDETKLATFEGLVGLSLLLQLVISIWASLRAPTLKVSHALLAAFVCGCIAAAGLLLINMLFGGTIDFAFATTTYLQIVSLGALLSLVAAGLAVVLASRSRPRLAARQAAAS